MAGESSGHEDAPRGTGKKLASTIVSPYHVNNDDNVNVTFRSKSSTRALISLLWRKRHVLLISLIFIIMI